MDQITIDRVAAALAIVSPALASIPGRAVHIDGDMMCYVAGGGEDMSVATSRNILYSMVGTLTEQAQAERAVLHVTASGCLKGLRVLVPTSQPYQAHRKGSRRPKNWQYLRDFLAEYNGPAFRVKMWDDREADDGFGYVTNSRPNDVIATGDKDMRMLDGWHLDWVVKNLIHVPPGTYEMDVNGKLYGYKWFLQQMLQGDTADHIRGLGKCAAAPRGCGEATAKKMLAGTTCKEEGIDAVVGFYKGAFDGKWANEFAEQAMLLWIRRGQSALLDEFMAFTPMPTEADGAELRAAVRAIKLRVREQQEEAAALCR